VWTGQTQVAELQPHPLRKGSHYRAATHITIPQLLLYRKVMYTHRNSSGLIPCPQLRCRDEEVMLPVKLESLYFLKLYRVESPPPRPVLNTASTTHMPWPIAHHRPSCNTDPLARGSGSKNKTRPTQAHISCFPPLCFSTQNFPYQNRFYSSHSYRRLK
jgi:hypothetical protein